MFVKEKLKPKEVLFNVNYILYRGEKIPVFDLTNIKINNRSELENIFKEFLDNFFKNDIYYCEKILVNFKRKDFLLSIKYKGYEFFLQLRVDFSSNSGRLRHLRLKKIIYGNSVFTKINGKWEFSSYENKGPNKRLFKDIKSTFIEAIIFYKNEFKDRLREILFACERFPYKD